MCERYVDQLPLACPQPGTWPTTQACVLAGNRTGELLVCRTELCPPARALLKFNSCITNDFITVYNKQTRGNICKLSLRGKRWIKQVMRRAPTSHSQTREWGQPLNTHKGAHPQRSQETDSNTIPSATHQTGKIKDVLMTSGIGEDKEKPTFSSAASRRIN